jgi:hypothetical protein
MKRPLSILLASALLGTSVDASAQVTRAAGAVKAGPSVGIVPSLPGSQLGLAPRSVAPLSLSPSVPVSAPNLSPSVLPGMAVPAAAMSPSAVPAAAAAGAPAVSVPSLKAPSSVPAQAASAPHDAPVSAQGSLDSIAAEAASLSAGVSQLSAGDAKTRAAFDVEGARRSDLTDPVFAGQGVFGRQARRLAPVSSIANDAPAPSSLPAPKQPSAFAARWDRWTQNLTDFAAVPFLALQAPQIWANVQNLLAGHPEALVNLPWIGYSTGILGNMLLLGWFASQKEKSAARVQAIGVVTSAVVVTQIFLAGHMPLLAFAAVMPAIVAGLLINFAKIKDKAPAALWNVWSKGSSLLGLVILPQVLWTTFAPAAYASFLPAVLSAALGIGLSYLDSKGRLPGALKSVWGNLGAWTATLLFMYGPVAQLMANVSNPAGMAGIAIGTLLLAMAGNLLMLPRAMHTRNAIWFTGSAWGVVMGGWAVLLTMFLAGFAAPWLFWAATFAVPAWLGSAYLLSRLSRR